MATPNKEQFYQDITADTFCGYQWCKKLYGYSMYDKPFLERVFARLDELGRSRVKVIYAIYFKWQMALELEQDKSAAHWLVERTDKEYERNVKECQKQQKEEMGCSWMNGMF